MRIALRLAAGCAILFGVLWPTAALSDEATLKRTAPDDCIAWFSWAGLDALAEGGDKSNRTEQLLADEEVRAFFDSIAKGIKVASQPGNDEETQLTLKLFDTLSKRPVVGFLSKIAEVKQDAPPKASEPVILPPATATIVPTTKVTVGADGLERIGVDFDVQVTASDASQQTAGPAKPQAGTAAIAGPKVGRTRLVGEKGRERREVELIWPNKTEWREIQTDVEFGTNGEAKSTSNRELSKAEIESLVANIPKPEFSFGRSRTVIVDGKQQKEVEIIGPNGAEWIGIDFDFDLNDIQPSKCSVADRIFDVFYDLPAVGNCVRAVDAAIWVSKQASTSSQLNEPQSETRAAIEIEDGRIAVPFDFDLDEPRSDGAPRVNAGNVAEYRNPAAKLQESYQADQVRAASVEPAAAVPKFVDIDSIVHETRTGKLMIGGTSAGSVLEAPAAPAAPAAALTTPPAPATPPACTTCQGCQTCQAASESTITKTVYQGAIVADLGPRAADMRAYYDKLESQGQNLPREKIADVEFIRLDMDQPFWLAFHEAYAIVAFDKASAEQVLLGLAGKREIPKWLDDAETKLPVERPAARIHINIDSIAKLVDEPFEAPSQELVKSLGLDQVSAISFVAGLDDHGTAVKTLIATRDGAKVSAVLDFFGDKGLAADDLKVIPKDSTFAAAGKLDISKLFNLGLKLATIDDQGAGDAWEETKKHLAEQLFIDFSKDILAALGDTWTIHSSPSEGGLMATTFTLAVRDEAKLKSVIEKFAVLANSGEKVISRFKYRDQEVYYVNQPDAGIMVSWCIKDGRLVASMLPQTIKAHIARGPVKESLAEVARVKQTIDRAQKAVGQSAVDATEIKRSNLYVLTYTDTPAILRWCYQYGSFLLPTIGAGLSEMTPADGPKFEFHEIPSLAVIEHYFEPSITTFSRTDHGLLFDSRQTVPMFSGMFFSLTAASSFEHVMGPPLGLADLNNVVDIATSVAELPIGIATGMSGGGCSNGSCGTPPSPFWMQSDVQYYAPSTDTPPPLPPGSQPGPWTQPPAYPATAPAATPIPYAPSIPGQAYPPPPAIPPAAPPAYSTGAPPVAMPYVTPGYTAPSKPLPNPVAPNVPLSVPAGLAPHIKAPPAPQPAPVAPPAPAVLQNIPAGKLWQGKPAASAAVPSPIPPTAYAYASPATTYPPAPPAPPVAATYAVPSIAAYPAPVASSPVVPAAPNHPGLKPVQGLHMISPLLQNNSATEAKPAAKPSTEPNTRPPRRLLRRRAAVSLPQGMSQPPAIASALPVFNLRLSDQAPAKTVAASTVLATVSPQTDPSDYLIDSLDVVSICVKTAVSKHPRPARPLDTYLFLESSPRPIEPVDGLRTVDLTSFWRLGPSDGTVEVDDTSYDEAYLNVFARVNSVRDNAIRWIAGDDECEIHHQVGGAHLVSIDGKINLGDFGLVHVAGLNIHQAEKAVVDHLAKMKSDVSLSLAVFGYHKKSLHVVLEDAAKSHVVECVPNTSKMTALDALKNVADVRPPKTKNIWIARQSPIAGQAEQIFPVQWPAVPKHSLLAFDREIQPGDRIVVTDRKMPGLTMSF